MYPAPAVVASAYDKDGNADACTLAFATMCSHHPPAVMIALNLPTFLEGGDSQT